MGGPVLAQDADDDDYVSRSEYEQLRQELQQLREELGAARDEEAAEEDDADEQAVDAPLPRWEAEEYFDFLDAQMREVEAKAAAAEPGTSRFLLSGYGAADFTYRRGEETAFGVTLAPVFLWQPSDRLLFEAEPKFSLGSDGDTSVHLEYANASFLLHDYVTVGAGQFLTPLGIFNERLHPAWINKLPDAPLAFEHHGGLAPESSLGAFVRGGLPLGPVQRMNYTAYVANAPRLITEGHHAGELSFDAWDNVDRNLAVGSRIGYLPFPEWEVGYSFLFAPRVDPAGFDERVSAQLHAVDLSYVRDVDWLGGRIDLRTEWILSAVDDAVFFDHGDPLPTFTNRRWGGYVQGAYRPLSDNEILRNLEFVYRYDLVDHPRNAPSGSDTDRHTWGANYWLADTTVLKSAFQYVSRSERAVLLQFAMGF